MTQWTGIDDSEIVKRLCETTKEERKLEKWSNAEERGRGKVNVPTERDFS